MTQTKIKQSSKQAIKQPNNQTIDIETVAVLVAAVVEVAEGVPTAQVACQSSGTSRSSRGGISTNSTITSNHFARRHCKQLSDKHNVPKIGWDPSRSARLIIITTTTTTITTTTTTTTTTSSTTTTTTTTTATSLFS